MRKLYVLALIVTLLNCSLAHAYIGPGVTTGVLGVLLGIISAFVLAVAGVIYYPIKRLLKRRKTSAPTSDDARMEKTE